jgi:16S rRNA (guanine527-N7)-methyltransferase
MSSDPSFRDLMAGSVPGDRLSLLVRYAELVERWSHTHSLVRWRGRRDLVERHILEALAASPLLGSHGRLLDVGSGAGLPGIPLLVACAGWQGLLLEPRQKRWAFLKLVIRELGLEAEVRRVRYQDLQEEGLVDLITCRALGGYHELLAWAGNRLCPGGQVVLWTTADEQEWAAEFTQWRVLSSPLPGLDRGRLVQMRPCFT